MNNGKVKKLKRELKSAFRDQGRLVLDLLHGLSFWQRVRWASKIVFRIR